MLKSKKPRKPRKLLAQKTSQQLIPEADKYFSRYVRLRDCERKDNVWVGTCITCSKTGVVAWLDGKQLRFTPGWDAGHFVSRGNKISRFEDENVNLQCAYRCNKLRSGEHEKYRVALRAKYGDDVPEKLEQLAENTSYYKFSKPELLQVIEDSKTAVAFYLGN